MTTGLGLKLFAVAATFCMAATVEATTAWDESINGDLSNSGLVPTSLAFAMGSNTVLGSTGNANQGERDYFRFTVPDGTELTSLVVLPNTFVSGDVSFIAFQAGPQVTAGTSGAGIENLLAYGHYGNDFIGTDIFPNFFTAPLASGTYSVWVQETGGIVDYGFDFVITPVPLPGALVLLLSGLFSLTPLLRRKDSAALAFV